MTLTEFLEARITQDALRARLIRLSCERTGWGEYPARLVAECAAKRAIVKEHEDDSCGECLTCGVTWNGWPCLTLRVLAGVYVDHKDFRPDWKV